MSLYSAAERLASLDRSSVTFNPHRCLHTHDHFSDCDVCVQTCPTSAVKAGKPPVLDAEACVHCLACLPACPTGAFRANDAIPALLNCTTRSNSSRIELLCVNNPHCDRVSLQTAQGILWPDCLAALGSGGYLALGALGLQQVIVRLDACSQCPWISLRGEVEAQVAFACKLLTPFEKENTLCWVDQAKERPEHPLLDVKNPPLSRRDLFRMAARQGQAALARAVEWNAEADQPQPGIDRMRIVAALRYFSPPVSTANPVLDACGFSLVTVSEDCSACGSCWRACPTAALKFSLDEAERSYQITFLPSACIGCGICERVCEPGAISIQAAPTFSDVFGVQEALPLRTGLFARCDRCNSVYPARDGTRLCPVCEYRRKNPFGSRLPAGLTRARHQENSQETSK